jgi:hypothetical protein
MAVGGFVGRGWGCLCGYGYELLLLEGKEWWIDGMVK